MNQKPLENSNKQNNMKLISLNSKMKVIDIQKKLIKLVYKTLKKNYFKNHNNKSKIASIELLYFYLNLLIIKMN